MTVPELAAGVRVAFDPEAHGLVEQADNDEIEWADCGPIGTEELPP